MGSRTSQLQIRVTPAEKATLKRLASAEGETVSSYVLSRVLPSTELELAAGMRRLAEPGMDQREALVEMVELLERIPGAELAGSVPAPDAKEVPPVVRNRIAALVESEAHRKATEPPDWVRSVPRLPRPHFDWLLTSLKPHQLRVTPVAFKRRNLFFDPATAPALARPSLRAREKYEGSLDVRPELELFARLGRALRTSDIEVEFYFIGGALLSQAFSADPDTVRVSVLFRPAAPVREAIASVGRAEGLGESWPPGAARTLLRSASPGGSVDYVELPGVRVFEPPPEYALAVACAAARTEDDARGLEDLRYLLRAMNVTSVDTALSLVRAYFADRQLPSTARARLEAILPS